MALGQLHSFHESLYYKEEDDDPYRNDVELVGNMSSFRCSGHYVEKNEWNTIILMMLDLFNVVTFQLKNWNS